MPGFAMENDYYSSSKQKEIKKKVIQTFPIFPIKKCSLNLSLIRQVLKQTILPLRYKPMRVLA
jgi:hypothetical protein